MSARLQSEPLPIRLVKTSLNRAPGIDVTLIGHPGIGSQIRRARTMTRRQRWMLLLAFEVLVFGFAQAVYQPVRRPGITVETTVTPNHVVT